MHVFSMILRFLSTPQEKMLEKGILATFQTNINLQMFRDEFAVKKKFF